jgi:iron complex outermembrane receptor protein
MRKILFLFFFFLLAVISLYSFEIMAEQNNEESYLSLFYPKSQIVSGATKTAEDVKTAPATVRVFTKEEIKDLGVETLSDLLNLLSSTLVTTQTNSRDSLWIRGIRNRYNDKVLILVDSVPISDPVYSHSPIDEYLTLENVERVEIIFGPASALYGSNSFAGTINIITKKPKDGAFLNISAKGGNYDTKGAFAEYNYKKGDFGIYSYFSYFETDGDGLDRQRQYLPQTLKWNPKERISGGLTIEYKDWFLRVNRVHYYHTFYSDWDIPTWRWKDEGYFYNDTFTSLEKEFVLSQNLALSFKSYYADFDLRNYWREFGYSWSGVEPDPDNVNSWVEKSISVFKNGIKFGGDLQFNYSLSDKANTIAGIAFDRVKTGRVEDLWLDVQTGVTTRPFYIDPHSLNNYAAYFQQSYKPNDRLSLLGGVRIDHLDLYGYKTTPRVNIVYTPTKKTVFKCLYGEAFRQPSMREYYTVDLTHSFPAGNTDLKPEKIRTLEVSGSYFSEKSGSFSLTLFSEWTYDEIFSENNAPYQNQEGNRIRGMEAGYHYSSEITELNFNYSRNWCSLYNVPPYIVKGESVISLKDKIKLSLYGGYVAKRPRDPKDLFYYDPTRPPYKRGDVPGYFLINTTLTFYPFLKNLELSASIYNLLDKDYFFPTYEPTKYYDLKAPNRTFLLRIGYKF